jgi:hypothetical protein
MNYLFTNAPIFVPTTDLAQFNLHDLEHRAAELEHKQAHVTHTEAEVAEEPKVG